MKCPWCHRPIPNDRTFSVKKLQEKAIKWLLKNKHLWIGQVVENYKPHKVSDAWAHIAFGLKRDGIYKKSYGTWDMSIDSLVNQARERIKSPTQEK